MAKRIRLCPRCMNMLRKNDEKCSSCGLEVSKMRELEERQADLDARAAQEKAELEEKQEEKEELKVDENGVVVDTTLVLAGEENSTSNADENAEEKPKRHKHKARKREVPIEDRPKYEVDENGEFEIDTKDVTYLEGFSHEAYSVKKARGDESAREKIKWWEIYKWADLMLARRKINKEIKKAAYKMPYGVTKTGMLLLNIFFGWMGAHDFYAKNYKRGFTALAFTIIVGIVINVPVLYEHVGIFIGGGLGFVMMVMWLGDLVRIIMNHYQYRISKEEFISNLNYETRSKLSKKWWNFDRKTFKAKEDARIEKIKNKHKKKIKTENPGEQKK